EIYGSQFAPVARPPWQNGSTLFRTRPITGLNAKKRTVVNNGTSLPADVLYLPADTSTVLAADLLSESTEESMFIPENARLKFEFLSGTDDDVIWRANNEAFVVV